MKKVGFVGAFEKTDMILYVAKILTEVDKKVLMVDATILQRARYTVPCIAPSKYYVTEFESIDIAVGFKNLEEIKKYLGLEILDYDYILIDIGSNEAFYDYEMLDAEKNFFVTAFDNYSLKRGLEIIGKMEERIIMTKILFSREMLQEEDDYLNFLSFYFSVKWTNKKIYFPYETGDNSAIIENQRTARVRFKFLSEEYKEGLIKVASEIAPEENVNKLKKIYKII